MRVYIFSHFMLILFGYSFSMRAKIEILIAIIVPIIITLAVSVLLVFWVNSSSNNYASVNIYSNSGKLVVNNNDTNSTIFKDIKPAIYLFKTKNSITIDDIANFDDKFKPFLPKENFSDTNTTYWLKIDLGKNFPTGRFICTYGDADFFASSIKKHQNLQKFKLDGTQNFSFSYSRGDARVYYFKLLPKRYKKAYKFIEIATPKTFYAYSNLYNKIEILLGVVLGLILMASIYNFALFYYNREKSFLYYCLMQLAMVLTLYDLSGAFAWIEESIFFRNETVLEILVLSVAIFAGFFAATFLDFKKFLPKLNRVVKIILIAIGIDIVITLFYKSFIVEYKLHTLFIIPLIYGGYIRAKDGYKPALFYLAGWSALGFAIFLSVFHLKVEYFAFDPIYIGAVLEAILFSLALSYRFRLAAKEKEREKQMLIQQSKLATIGELLGNIAHQWRQPLNYLGYTFMNIQDAHKNHELDESYLNKKLGDAQKQLEYLSQTIDDFRDFYSPNKEKELFSLHEATKETVQLISDMLKSNDIKIELILNEDIKLHSFKNDYKQALLNIINNAKEALIERAIIEPKITITANKNLITIADNAGGIDKKIIDRVFEPYYTTKEKSSGIGLYIAKMLLERNMGAILELKSREEGALFTIRHSL